jgi:mannosyltransferase OCH1-like enzyme
MGIPKLIHQIWLGKNPKPQEWMDTVKEFAGIHGFAYKLWTDREILERYPLGAPLQAVYDDLEELAGKADILRLILLYNLGGLYVDADCVILNPQKLHAFLEADNSETFFSWEKIDDKDLPRLRPYFGKELQGMNDLIGNSIIGAKPEAGFIKKLLEEIVPNALQQGGKLWAWHTVGPLFITKVWKREGGRYPGLKIYPGRAFYPMHWIGITDPEFHKKLKDTGEAMFFQYGYSTNGFAEYFKKKAGLSGGGATATIPRIIHQIWLGDNPRPLEWMDTVKQFADKHGFTYKLWTEKEADKDLEWDAFPGLRRIYGGFRKELAGKADIIRLLALYQYGGIYIDADTVMMKPAKFAEFIDDNRGAVFFAWEHIHRSHTKKLGDFGKELRGARRLIANGVIGAVEHHPFIEALIKGVRANAEREKDEAAWRKVGPLYVTRMYHKLKGKYPEIKIYPMRYFYPRHWRGIRDPELHKKVRIPKESMMFQYGYSTNKFAEIFKDLRKRTRKLKR